MDNLYYKDENCGKYCKKELKYCDCKGNEQCITYYEPLPYRQAEEILAPVFISDSFNSIKHCKNCIISSKKCGNSVEIEVKYPMKVGDLWSAFTNKNPMYFVFKRKGRSKKGNFKILLKRLDRSNIVDLDLENLKKKTKIVYRGFTN